MLCSRGMGLSLMNGFTSGNIAWGTNILKPCDKAGVTAASPLLFKLMSVRVCERKGERACLSVLWCSPPKLQWTVGCSNHNAMESLGDWYINLTWLLRQLRGDKAPPTSARPCDSLCQWAKERTSLHGKTDT